MASVSVNHDGDYKFNYKALGFNWRSSGGLSNFEWMYLLLGHLRRLLLGLLRRRLRRNDKSLAGFSNFSFFFPAPLCSRSITYKKNKNKNKQTIITIIIDRVKRQSLGIHRLVPEELKRPTALNQNQSKSTASSNHHQ